MSVGVSGNFYIKKSLEKGEEDYGTDLQDWR